MIECKLCGAQVRNDQDLHEHLLGIHLQWSGWPYERATCWCGTAYLARLGSRNGIDDHWANEGGYATHYLTCKLGVSNG